jgi:peptide/nickel transport system ATP-binding protein
MNIPALNVKNLSVWVNTAKGRVQVVDSISFDLDTGQTAGLVGESGCGKTMTALAILGLLQAPAVMVKSDGIEINGNDISILNSEQKRSVLGRDIAMIFQQPGTAFDPVFTIGQQLAAVYRRHVGGSRTGIRNAVLDSLELVGFSQAKEIVAAYPHQLSGGMRQLAMIAMAMVCKPAVMIADEPTTALDARSRALILQQLENLQAVHNTAILLISHDLAVVRQSCRKVMVMYCGRILENTDNKRLFSHARHPYSAGLLACIPEIESGQPGAIRSIAGQVPSASEMPPGCHFAPRCDRAQPQCLESVPVLDLENGAGVACFRPL